ncbi:MAG: adenylate/guanylate cyclase domain-containing protein, partial [Candidatus Baltobacteraceae bacterium]
MPEVHLPAADSLRHDRPSGTVAFLFTDIEGSTRRWERYREAMAEAITRHDALLRGGIEARGGYVFKNVGDAVYAAFERISDAVLAARDTQRALAAEDFSAVEGLAVRMAVHVGEVFERDGDYFGPVLNRVARLLALGHGGQILVSASAADLLRGVLPEPLALRGLGAHRLKGLAVDEPIYQLVAPELRDRFPDLHASVTTPNNLSQFSRLVGRDDVVKEVEEVVADRRLTTIVGAGGIGKTRVALQIAADLFERFPAGVWLVEFAPLHDAELVPSAIGAVLHVRESGEEPVLVTVLRALGDRRVLLVLDNCEHLITEVAVVVDEILRTSAGVHVLATSRKSLGIGGERVYRLPALGVPPADPAPTARELARYGATALFIERAQLIDGRFSVSDQSAPMVADICRRLDGIALALELAAARTNVLSLPDLARRLDDRFGLLTAGSRASLPRQQTMHALIDWSYELLSADEQTLFRRLFVFSGGWTLEAAETVCAEGGSESSSILQRLCSLVDKSLVVAELNASAARYRLLESMRAYAAQKVSESERNVLEAAHARWIAALAERA